MISSQQDKSSKKHPVNWEDANRHFLQLKLEWLKLLLHRRILWLRSQWKHDPLNEYQGLVISDNHADWLLSGESYKAEARFYGEDKNASDISREIATIEEKISKHINEMTEAGQSPGLTFLANIFGLSVFEQNVLMLCLAPELDPAFERLYAYVQDDISRKFPTPYLALSLFGRSLNDTDRNCFLPGAPLRHYHMLSFSDPQHRSCATFSQYLGLDERVGHFIRGVNFIDERIVHCAVQPEETATVEQYAHVADTIERVIGSSASKGQWPCINLIGPSKGGKLSVLREVCDRIAYKVMHIDVSKLPSDYSERLQFIRLLEREAVISRLAYYIDASEADHAGENDAEAISVLIENIRVLVFLESRQRWRCRRNVTLVDVPDIDNDSLKALWIDALCDTEIHEKEGLIDEIVQQFMFSPASIKAITTEAAGSAQNKSLKNVSYEEFWKICRKHASSGMEGLARRIVPVYGWDDIVLQHDTKLQLREIADQAGNRGKVYEEWGFGEKLSRGRGISALFSGPSGTGKTMAAEVIACQLNLDLNRIDLSSVVSKYIGETEKNLRKVFDAAERSGAILFFDEADALFAKRTEIRDSHDRYANLEVNYLLQRMEDYRGLAILATNNKSQIDHAFMRRIRFIVDFPFPDFRERQDIWKKSFPTRVPVAGLDWDALARLEIPGGNIRNIALNAAFLAAGEGTSVDMGKIMHAARREYMKMDRLITESEFGEHYSLVKA